MNSTSEERYVLNDIVGYAGLPSVPCLHSSSTIAGKASCAYRGVFSLSYACGRSVRVGANLVRLDLPTVQSAPHSLIILTGYESLNKLMDSQIPY